MRVLLVLIASILVACGGDTEDNEENKDPIGASYHESLDKAENVEAIVEEHAEAQRKEIEEAEGN